jgi:uncharacterized protein YdiU (UPF0061 family)
VRFGSFQLPASRGDDALVANLVDYLIRHHYPGCSRAAWFTELSERTGALAAAWQAVGFVHGVLNTDNCSALGETIDYGPYGWMERYDPQFTPNTTDLPGRRYCYANQPAVMHWNVAQLANALLAASVLSREEAQAGVDSYRPAYEASHASRFASKLGLAPGERCGVLVERLLELMEGEAADFTRTFRALSRVPSSPPAADAAAQALLQPLAGVLPAALPAARSAAWAAWMSDYGAALAHEGRPHEERAAEQDGANPLYVPRNYLLQASIERAETGDDGGVHELLAVLEHPFLEQPGREAYAAAAPEWALETPGVCVLSCSS